MLQTNPFPPATESVKAKVADVSVWNKHGKEQHVLKGNAFDDAFVHGKKFAGEPHEEQP